MTSHKQRAGNQRNALKSTGPKSKTGLLAVSQNAVIHGFLANTHVVLPGESLEAYQALVTTLEANFAAETKAEQVLVKKMADALWKRQRLTLIENTLLQAQEARKLLDSDEDGERKRNTEKQKSLVKEIKALTEGLSSLREQVAEAKRINRIRALETFQEEARDWAVSTFEEIKELDQLLDRFLSNEELQDARQAMQFTIGGEYSADRWHKRCAFHYTFKLAKDEDDGDDEDEEDDGEDIQDSKTIEKPLNIYALKGFMALMEERLALKCQELSHFESLLAQEKQIDMAGAGLYLSEEEHIRLQGYESFLDNQFYRALAELQKLQAFLIKKREHLVVKNGFVPENSPASITLEVDCR